MYAIFSSSWKVKAMGTYLMMHLFINLECFLIHVWKFTWTRMRSVCNKNYSNINENTLLLLAVKCQHPYYTPKWVSVNGPLVMLSVANACWWWAWRILDWFQHWQPRHLFLLLSGRCSRAGSAVRLKQKINRCNIYISISKRILERKRCFFLFTKDDQWETLCITVNELQSYSVTGKWGAQPTM